MRGNRNDAEVFRANLRRLLDWHWLSQRQAADEIGVPYKWMRRLCHEGVQRIDRRTARSLKKVAGHFGLQPDDLWADELKVSQSRPRPDSCLIKWTGSKRTQAREIVSRFPSQIGTYYEPFLGGGAVLYEVLGNGLNVKRIRCSDTCAPLIALWQLVKKEPGRIVREYERMWSAIRRRGAEVYFEVRDSFNRTQDPCEFFFLLRTCRNGFVRFNTSGKFTTGYHIGRAGISPQQVRVLLRDWHEKLGKKDVQFSVRDYQKVSSRPGDLIYLDPPYRVSESRFYNGMIDFPEFYSWLSHQQGTYLLSLNGFVGDIDHTLDVPEHLYDEHVQIDVGVLPYRKKSSSPVTNSLYVRGR